MRQRPPSPVNRWSTSRSTSRSASWAIVIAGCLLVAGCSSADPDADEATPATPATTDTTTSATAAQTQTSPPTSAPPATTTTTTTTTTASTTVDPTVDAAVTTTSPTATAVPESAWPPQPDGVPWPTVEWPVAELPDGVDGELVDTVVDTSFGAADNPARLRSILAVHGGAVVYERYHPLDPPDTLLNSFSVAKSFTSSVVGLLVDDGVLDPVAPAPVPEWADDERAAITLEHLLQMRSGLNWEEVYGEGGTLGTMLASADWAGWAIDQPLEADPGERFEYSTGTTAILAEIVADRVGGPDALEDFMRTELLDPLGITSTNFVEDPTGQFAGGLGFDSTTRDFARFGYLFLRGGEWDGAQILSPEWIEYSRTPSPANPGYGAQWWLDGPDGTMLARGLFGQYILVVPELDLVIVATSTQGGDSWTPMITLYDQFAALG